MTGFGRREHAAGFSAARSFWWLAGLCLLMPAHVLAAGAATLEISADQSSSRMDMSWRDQNLRMEMPDQGSAYLLIHGDKAYSVTTEQGQTMVLDMSSMREMAQSGNEDVDLGSLEQLEATGESETIAGIEGEVYRVVWTDGNGQTHEDTAVLSDNAVVRGMTDAFRRSAEAMGGNADPFNDALDQRNAGILRFSDDFRVVSISGDAPPASDFELPAEPMSLEDLMRQQMGQ
jgi:osmotically-inducible protein OsmY